MPNIEQIFIAAALFSTISIIANAQGAVSYRFLEVVDYQNKPVIEATVSVQASCEDRETKTNAKGQSEKGFPIGFGDCQTRSFNISKEGYYSFADYFGVSSRAKLFYICCCWERSPPCLRVYLIQFDTPARRTVISGLAILKLILPCYLTGMISPNEIIKIELLKIPQHTAEKKAIGQEQMLPLFEWAINDLNVPTVEPRIFKPTARQICQLATDSNSIELIIKERPTIFADSLQIKRINCIKLERNAE
jgi:hypothetical protein